MKTTMKNMTRRNRPVRRSKTRTAISNNQENEILIFSILINFYFKSKKYCRGKTKVTFKLVEKY